MAERTDVETKYGPVSVRFGRGRSGDLGELNVKGDLKVHGVTYRALSMDMRRSGEAWEVVWDSVCVPARAVSLAARRTIREEFGDELVAWLAGDSASRRAAEVAYWTACEAEALARIDRLRAEMREQRDRRKACNVRARWVDVYGSARAAEMMAEEAEPPPIERDGIAPRSVRDRGR